MAVYDVIGISYELDTTDLMTGLKDAKKVISASNKEFKSATAGMDNWRKSTEGVTAKLKQLDTQVKVQQEVVEGYEKEIERVKNQEGDHTEELKKLAEGLEDAKTKVKNTQKQISKFTDTLEELKSTEKETESATGKLSKKIKDQEDAVDSLSKEYKEAVLQFGKTSDEAKALERRLSDATNELKDSKKAMADAEYQADDLEDALDDLSDSAKESGDGFTILKGTIANLISSGISNLVGGIRGAIDESREFRAEQSKLMASMDDSGYSAEYTSDKFDDLNSIMNDPTASATAISNFGAIGLAEKDLDKILHASVGIWSKYGDSLPIDGLAESINETVKVGQVTGGLADALNWAGISEDDFNEKLEKCTTEQERQQLIVKTLEKSYGGLADSYKENNKDLIASNKASQDYAKAIANVAEKFEPIITTIKQGFADVLNEFMKLTKGIDFDKITEGIEDAFGWFIDEAMPFLKNNLPTIASLITGIGTAFLAWKIKGIIEGLITSIGGMVTALITATTAQNGLNTAMKANVIGAVISIVLALVTAFITLWKTSDEFRAFWIGLWETIKTTTSNVVEWIGYFFTNLWDDIKSIWNGAGEWFSNLWDGIKQTASDLWVAVKGFFVDAWDGIKNVWGVVADWFSNLWDTIKQTASDLWEAVKKFFSDAWEAIKTAWDGAVNWFGDIWDGIKDVFANVKTWFKTKFQGAWTSVKNVWSKVGDWFGDRWDDITGVFKGITTWFSDKFGDAWQGIKDVFSGVGSFFGGIWDTIKETFSTIGTKVAEAIGGAFKTAINAVIGVVEGAINLIPNAINKALDAINKLPMVNISPIPTVSLPRLAKGGVVDKATLAEVGEDGAEAIVPLERNTKWIDKLAEQITQSMSQGDTGAYSSTSTFGVNKALASVDGQLDDINEKLIKASKNQDDWINSLDGVNSQAELLSRQYDAQQEKMQLLNREYELAVQNSPYGEMGKEAQKTAQEIEQLKQEMAKTVTEAQSLKVVAEELEKIEPIEIEAKIVVEAPQDVDVSWAKGLTKKFIDEANKAQRELETTNYMQMYAKEVENGFKHLEDIAGQSIGRINDLIRQGMEQRISAIDEELKANENLYKQKTNIAIGESNAQMQALEKQFADGIIDEATYYAKLDKLEADSVAKQKKLDEQKAKNEAKLKKEQNRLAEKAFKANQKNQIAQVWINAGAGIARAWAENFWGVALGISGAIGAEAIVQTNAIKKQKFTPAFAKGGIITRPTIGLVGEAGKEAIMPLEKNVGWIKELAVQLGEFAEDNQRLNGGGYNNVDNHSRVNNFTQVINAPKQPSRIELYRQTKNLLALRSL